MKRNCLIKRSLAWIVFLILFQATAFSQLKFSAGPVIGIQGSQISGDNYGGYNQPGLYAGLFTNIRRNDDVSFQIEVAYSQKGARKIPNPRFNDFTSYDLRLNYIEVPVYFRKAFRSFSFDFGLSYGRLLSYFEEDQFGTMQPQRPFRRYDMGWLLGAGYAWGESVLFSVRVVRSFVPVRNHQAQQAFWWNPGQLNNVLVFSVSYQFGSKND